MTDHELRAECAEILAYAAKYPLTSRSITTENGYSWGDWIDAAHYVLESGDFSEYRYMSGNKELEEDNDAFVDALYDFAMSAVRSTEGMAAND